MSELKLCLYCVNDKYVEYLRECVSEKVLSNVGANYSVSRKYLGVVLKIETYDYYVPLSSPKNVDYFQNEGGKKVIRKSIVPIIRIIETSFDGRKSLLGTLKFSSMIPVPPDEISLYDVNSETDIKYKNLIMKELRFIRRNTEQIIKNASLIYKQKKLNLNINYLNSTVNFELLEIAHDNYLKKLTPHL